VLVLFVGAVNHWVTVVLHKQTTKQIPTVDQMKVVDGRKFLIYVYLMDSQNIVHLDQ
jgi:hypothetical protein